MKNLKVFQQLALGFLIPVLFLIASGVVSSLSLRAANHGLRTIYDDRVVPLAGLKVIADSFAVDVIDAVNKANAGLMTAEDILTVLQNARQTIDREWQAYMATTLTPEEAKLAAEAQALFVQANRDMDRLISDLSHSYAGMVTGLLEEYDGPLYKSIDPISNKITELIDLQLRVAAEEVSTVDAAYRFALTMTFALMGVAALISIGFAIVITRGITRQLGAEPADLKRQADAVAAGDLMQPIHVQPSDTGSVMAALKTMQNNLVKVVGEVRVASDGVATGSQEIASGTLDLSQRTEEQASNLEETAASMEELTVTVKQNADTARQASQLAHGASEAAVRGGEVVGQVVTTMQDITTSSKKIVDIISVIDGIAFQTNILALNAAVEAARAGEQGRGFAVVAGEVRTLAQRSAAAAKEIKDLITASVERVETGSQLVAQAGESVSDIVAQVKRVTDLINEITAASNEQASGIAQVGDAVNQLDQVTQQNAALVEESTAAAESLKVQAARLSEVVSVFKLSSHSVAQPQRSHAAAAPRPEPRVPKAAAPKPLAQPCKVDVKHLPSTNPKAAATKANDQADEWSSF